MDSFVFSNIKAEKVHAKLRYRRIQKITAMFRLIELCILLIIISRFTTQLPVVFKHSGEYFKGLSVTAISPRLVFIVGNVIVIVLFLKSGKFSGKDGESSNGKLDLYDEYVKNCEKSRNAYIQEIKKYRKESTCVIKKEALFSDVNNPKEKKINRCHSENLKTLQHELMARDANSPKEKKINRCHSENLKRLQHDVVDRGRELRRAVTEISRKSVNNGEKTAKSSYPEDQMSSEEFRRTVEAFIARHQRTLREEEFSVIDSFGASY